MADPLTVPCPDCIVPAGTRCDVSHDGLGPHATRQDAADHAALTRGTCDLCGQPMFRGRMRGSDTVDAWHGAPEDAVLCPPIPDPAVNWNAYAQAIQDGARPGRPGIEHFTPASPTQP